jgi:endoglucanase
MIRSYLWTAIFAACVPGSAIVATACSGNSSSREKTQSTGSVSLPLVTVTGASKYRLENVVIDFNGPVFVPPLTESNLNEAVLSTTLPTGSYEAVLVNWTLSKDDGQGNFKPVVASLEQNNEPFTVFDGTTTTLVFRFQTDGIIVTVGSGELHVTAAVDPVPPICTVLGDGCAPGTWCAPAGLTGAPLACISAGTVSVGQPCAGPTDCVANASCFDLGAGPVCGAMCSNGSLDTPCDTGGTCLPGGTDFGICRSIASGNGCPSAPTHPVAPSGYYVEGNTVCTADGRGHLFHGVDRPSLEWSSTGVNLSLPDFRRMASWNANVVRIALNQDFWIAESPLFDPNYASVVDGAIRWAEIAGMDVILDLHWSDRGVLGSCVPSAGCQQQMADVNSVTFWSQVAARYQNDGRVMFELYNEPHDVSWSVWQSGGDTGSGWQAVGMQRLYDTVRATGAHNLVVIGGLDWAYDLSGVPAYRINGYNILYATHPYNAIGAVERLPARWDSSWGFLTRTDAVIVTEFGDITGTCSVAYPTQVIRYADAHAAGWTAWAWYPGGCMFPALIDDWAGTTSPLGAIVKPSLLAYHDPPASPPAQGGSSKDFGYTFDVGTEGWGLSAYQDPTLTNLGARVPDGGSAATLRFASADGDQNSGPGSLKLTVPFAGLDQYVDAIVTLGTPGISLSGKTLHAAVRLVSGSFPEGGLLFHASTGTSFVYAAAPFVNASSFPIGQWVPLTFDLGAATAAGFDPAQVVQIGVQFFSGFSSSGGAFTGSDVVFELDSVTD